MQFLLGFLLKSEWHQISWIFPGWGIPYDVRAKVLDCSFEVSPNSSCDMFTLVTARLNGLVSRVTGFKEFSYITSPFCSQTGLTSLWKGLDSLDLRADVVIHSSAVSTLGLPLLFSRIEKSKWSLPFCCLDFSVCFLNICDSCIAWDGNFPYSTSNNHTSENPH